MSLVPGESSPRAPIVQATDLHVRLGGTEVISNLSITVDPGIVHGLVGPNGAGKTTLLNAISGFVPYGPGSIAFEGRDISKMRSWARASLGIGRTFQLPVLTDDRTVLDNVAIGAYGVAPSHLWDDIFATPFGTRQQRRRIDSARTALHAVGLEHVADEKAGGLPFGLRKMADLARAWAARPNLLMLDEPTAGMDDREIERLTAFLAVARQTATLLVIAHHVPFVTGIADVITVLDHGVVIAEGPPQEVRANPAVVASYIGGEA